MSMLLNPDMPLVPVEHVDPSSGEISVVWRQAFHSDLPSLTQQQFLDESDINSIIARYKVHGVVNSSGREPMYGDFSNMPSYQEALDIVNRGADIFMSLSSDIRGRFDNDPSKFLEFANDEANRDDLIKWGLVPKPDPRAATLDDVVEVLKAKPSEPPEGA